jgi:hypothetical protein
VAAVDRRPPQAKRLPRCPGVASLAILAPECGAVVMDEVSPSADGLGDISGEKGPRDE